MSDTFKPLPYEETVEHIARSVLQDEIEPHPDFTDFTADQKERIRQWGQVLVYTGFEAAIGLNMVKVPRHMAVLANSSAFLEQTADLGLEKGAIRP
jgi:hypothetical protein